MVASRPIAVHCGRLHVVTDTDGPHDPIDTAQAALAAGAPVVQVRVGVDYTDRRAWDLTRRIAALCRTHQATCLVNDRLHIAAACNEVHGGHVGAHDLPVDAARRVLGDTALLGGTCRDPGTARRLRDAGAGYLGAGPAYPTRTKTGLPDPIGPQGIRRIAAAVDIPVIAIGGVTPDTVGDLIAAGAHGVAVVGAVSRSADPYRATRELLDAIDTSVSPK